MAVFSQVLFRIIKEATLNAELDDHLGYEKGRPKKSKNKRNGYSSKTIKTEDGKFEIDTPSDPSGEFEPKLIKKNQTRFTSIGDKILSLYAKGMSTREIVEMFKKMYNADNSPSLISKVTNAVIEQVIEWQSRPHDPVYPIVYLDCIVVKIRHNRQVINKSIYLALGVNMEGHMELLGMWLNDNEGAMFWLNVLTELNNRGVEDILIASVDGLKGFPDAINAVYPQTHIQLCIVHMVRNAVKYVPWKDYKPVTADLKLIYQAFNEDGSILSKMVREISTDWQIMEGQLAQLEYLV